MPLALADTKYALGAAVVDVVILTIVTNPSTSLETDKLYKLFPLIAVE
jgi:hypothetical protein